MAGHRKLLSSTGSLEMALQAVCYYWQQLMGSCCAAEARQHPEGAAAVRERGIGTPDRPLEALLVFTDPDDWYLDLQLMTDLLVSGGAPLCCRQRSCKHRRMLRCRPLYSGVERPASCWGSRALQRRQHAHLACGSAAAEQCTSHRDLGQRLRCTRSTCVRRRILTWAQASWAQAGGVLQQP